MDARRKAKQTEPIHGKIVSKRLSEQREPEVCMKSPSLESRHESQIKSCHSLGQSWLPGLGAVTGLFHIFSGDILHIQAFNSQGPIGDRHYHTSLLGCLKDDSLLEFWPIPGPKAVPTIILSNVCPFQEDGPGS